MLAFPCNAFGGQEPGTWEEIQAFAKARNISFPIFPKVDVNGGQESPVFAFLKSSLPGAEGLLKVGSPVSGRGFFFFPDTQLAAGHKIRALMVPSQGEAEPQSCARGKPGHVGVMQHGPQGSSQHMQPRLHCDDGLPTALLGPCIQVTENPNKQPCTLCMSAGSDLSKNHPRAGQHGFPACQSRGGAWSMRPGAGVEP